LSKLTKEMV